MFLSKEDRQAKKEQKQRQKSLQEWINVKDIHSDMIVTRDNRLIKMLQVNTVNTQLMSDREIKDLFERYENFLRSAINENIQITVVSQPVDLSDYIKQQERMLHQTTDEPKKRLLRAYIEYNRDLELSDSVVQRKRYLIVDEKIKNDNVERAKKHLESKLEAIEKALSLMKLPSTRVSNLELIHYLHTMYDFDASQHQPIESEDVPPIISYSKEAVSYDEVASAREK